MSQPADTSQTNLPIWRVLGQAFAATFRKARPVFIAMAAATVAATLLELAPPFLLKRIIDSYLNAGRVDGLWVPAVLDVLANAAAQLLGGGLSGSAKT